MNIAKRSEITRARTDPIQIGYHPKNVNNTVVNKEVIVRVTSGFLPLVAIKATVRSPIVNTREKMIPASVEVVPIADAILVKYSDQITILIRLEKGEDVFISLYLSRGEHQRVSYEHYKNTDHKLVS